MTRGCVIELSIADQAACQHEHAGWIALKTANGVEQIRRGCLDCGWREKQSHPHRDHPDRGRYPLLLPRRESERQVYDYHAYLESERWLTRAEAAKARSGWRCQLCGDEEAPLQAHHNTYLRLGAELETDLTVLCPDCHTAFHDRRELAEQRERATA